jgi:Flagellar hook-length control protein
MALTGVGKSDLSTVVTDKEPRIKGQHRQEEEKENSANVGKEQRQEEKAEPFSLQLPAATAGTNKVKKAAMQQEETSGKDELAEQRDGEEKPVAAVADTATPSETQALINASSQDPILLSRWAELAKSSAAQTGGEALSGNERSTAADGIEATEVTGSKKETKPTLFASLTGSEAASEPESGAVSKETGQQRLQTALLSRGISLSSVMEQANSAKASTESVKASAKASTESIKTSTEARTQAVLTQNGSTTGSNLLSMAKAELSLSSTTATTSPISTADASSSVTSSAVQLPVSTTQGHEWSQLKLSSTQSHWGQQLVDTLKERVEMQYSQSIKQAHIRLDPPELGKLDLTVRIDGDKLSVQLNASNPVVRDALLQSSDRLRTALTTEHSGGVEVNVGQGDSQRQQQGTKDEETILAGRRDLMDSGSDSAVVDVTGLNALV